MIEGLHSLGNEQNANGDSIVELGNEEHLAVVNTFLNINKAIFVHWNNLRLSIKLRNMLALLLMQPNSLSVMKDVRARRGPACSTDYYLVKRKGICPMRKRIN
jgi:hypothetical protein